MIAFCVDQFSGSGGKKSLKWSKSKHIIQPSSLKKSACLQGGPGELIPSAIIGEWPGMPTMGPSLC